MSVVDVLCLCLVIKFSLFGSYFFSFNLIIIKNWIKEKKRLTEKNVFYAAFFFRNLLVATILKILVTNTKNYVQKLKTIKNRSC